MDKEKKHLIVFGYGLAIIIAFFVARHGMKHGGIGLISIIFLGIAGLLLVITAVNFRLLKPFYTKWMIGAHFIGTVISALILSVLFYVVFGVAGIILRLIRKDLLCQKIDINQSSYWIKREGETLNKECYKKQF